MSTVQSSSGGAKVPSNEPFLYKLEHVVWWFTDDHIGVTHTDCGRMGVRRGTRGIPVNCYDGKDPRLVLDEDAPPIGWFWFPRWQYAPCDRWLWGKDSSGEGFLCTMS